MKQELQFHQIATRTETGINLSRWQMSSVERRIPAKYSFQWQQAQDWLSQANWILSQASQEALQIKRQAYESGLRDGREKILQQAAETLASAHQKSRQFIEAQQESIVNLAFHIVKNILPSLDSASVQKALVESALSEISGEKYLRVYVSPDQIDTLDWLKQQKTIEIIVDPTLDAYGCIVESELGAIHCDIDKQLELLERELTGSASSSKQPVNNPSPVHDEKRHSSPDSGER